MIPRDFLIMVDGVSWEPESDAEDEEDEEDEDDAYIPSDDTGEEEASSEEDSEESNWEDEESGTLKFCFMMTFDNFFFSRLLL